MLVSIFTGFLGAGKTTVLQHVRQQLADIHGSEKVLTIVNDVSENNMDEYAFATAARDEGGSPALSVRGDVSALSGGCVCCNLLGTLVEELLRAYRDGFTYVLLECTGVADPVPVVATLSALPAFENKVYIDAIITVLHARSLWAATHVERTARDDVEETAGDEGSGVTYSVAVGDSDPLGGLQAQGANVLLVNHWESLATVGPEVLTAWKRALRAFTAVSNPSARVFFTNRGGRFAFAETVFRQRMFDADGLKPFFLRLYAESGKAVGDLGDPSEEAGELDSIGMRSFTFESTTSVVSIAALCRLLSARQGRSMLRNVWRSKGFFLAVDDSCRQDGVGSPTGVVAASPVRQFRWQTVGMHFDYGEVLPPHVPLRSRVPEPSAHPLTCQVVFIGRFASATNAKAQEVQAFFDSVAARTDYRVTPP